MYRPRWDELRRAQRTGENWARSGSGRAHPPPPATIRVIPFYTRTHSPIQTSHWSPRSFTTHVMPDPTKHCATHIKYVAIHLTTALSSLWEHSFFGHLCPSVLVVYLGLPSWCMTHSFVLRNCSWVNTFHKSILISYYYEQCNILLFVHISNNKHVIETTWIDHLEHTTQTSLYVYLIIRSFLY